ncbi:MAG TPA: hypothetical protein VIM53_00160 [Candidatus Saccharimonadales bacterium]
MLADSFSTAEVALSEVAPDFLPTTEALLADRPALLTGEDLALDGLIALSERREFSAPKVVKGRAHDPRNGQFMSQADSVALRVEVSERVATQLAVAQQRRAQAATRVSALGLGNFGSRSIAPTLDAHAKTANVSLARGDLSPYRGERDRSGNAAILMSRAGLTLNVSEVE